MVEKVSGIYRIVCVKNGRYYFGSSKDIQKRWSWHRYALRRGNHHNIHLQRTYDKYGEEEFRFELVEMVSKDKLVSVEQLYLVEHVGKSNCFNIATNANGGVGNVLTDEHKAKISKALKGRTPKNIDFLHTFKGMEGKKHSDEVKQKMSEKHLGERNAFYGKTHTKKTRKKIKQARAKQINIPKRKLTKQQIVEIKVRYHEGKEKQRDLAKDFGVSQRTIWNMIHIAGAISK